MLLPLFPLDTVLFPGMPLKLHIFEERYRLMINQCIEKKSPFGVVLLADGHQVGQHNVTPHMIGCTAMITQVQRLPQARLNILSVGQERFKIDSLNYEHAYLAAEVSLYPLEDSDPGITKRAGAKLHTLITAYLKALQEAGRIQLDAARVPTDPIALAYLAAIILPVGTEVQQELLAAPDTKHLLKQLLKAYALELALVERMREEAAREDSELPFSLN